MFSQKTVPELLDQRLDILERLSVGFRFSEGALWGIGCRATKDEVVEGQGLWIVRVVGGWSKKTAVY